MIASQKISELQCEHGVNPLDRAFANLYNEKRTGFLPLSLFPFKFAAELNTRANH